MYVYIYIYMSSKQRHTNSNNNSLINKQRKHVGSVYWKSLICRCFLS